MKKEFKNTFIKEIQPIIENNIKNVFNKYNLTLKDLGSYNTQSMVITPMSWSISGFDCILKAGSSAESFWNSIDTEWWEHIELNDDIDVTNPNYNELIKFFYDYLIENDYTYLLDIYVVFNKTKNNLTETETELISYLKSISTDTEIKTYEN